MATMLPHLRLVSLAKGAEARLCEMLGLQRVGVLGIMVHTPGLWLMTGWSAWCGDVVEDGGGEGREDGGSVDTGWGCEFCAYESQVD